MEKSKKSQRSRKSFKSYKSYNSISQAVSSQAQTPCDPSSLLGIEDNPEEYYVHSNPRQCGIFYEYIMDNLQFEVPETVKNISLRSFKSDKTLEQLKNYLFEANQNVVRSIIETSRYLWTIRTLLSMQKKGMLGLLISLLTILLVLIVEIFVNMKHMSDYYIGFIALGVVCVVGFPIIFQNGMISFVQIACFQLLLAGSIFYLTILQQSFNPSTSDYIFLIVYSVGYLVQLYFFFYFEIKRKLICYLFQYSEPY